MKITFTKYFFVFLSIFAFAFASHGQTTISGNVKDADTGEALIGVNIVVKGRVIGTISDFDGNFNLEVQSEPPITLVISIIGYEQQEIEILESTDNLQISMSEQAILGQEVVVSGSRIPESILESPVTVENIDILGIQQAAQADPFDALNFIKGVTSTTSSLTFNSINTRGFATIANVRFVTLVDGMDISAPLLNFPTGNLVGIGELDMESIELVPGSASALYGPNAFNGILFMNSKSPFEYQGLSAQVKVGVTSSNADGTHLLTNFAARYAKAFNNKWAIKFNFSRLGATDWLGNDYRTDINTLTEYASGAQLPSNFDGINTYGDETRVPVPISPFEVLDLRRTGWTEEQLLNNQDATSLKFDGALHFRPTDKLELLYNYRFGGGSSIYQGSAKFVLRDFTQQFHKIEAKADNFFVRSYMTVTEAGDSYNIAALGGLLSERITPTATEWAPIYGASYVGAIQGLVPGVPAGDEALAHQYARATADAERNALSPQELNDLIRLGQQERLQLDPFGSSFIENSRLFHTEFNYNFKNQISWMELQIGGNYRRYSIYSGGTIFDETPTANGEDFERISINEYGAYAQLGKRFGDLNLTASLRYDKNENFDGQFNPRVSAVYTIKEVHNIRASFQTGFRNPDSQAQFIWFPTGSGTLVGSTEANAEQYGIHNGGSYTRESVDQFLLTGGAFDQNTGEPIAGDPSILQIDDYDFVEPEELRSVEIGYKGLLNNGKILIDINGYYNWYDGFIANKPVYNVNPVTRRGEILRNSTDGGVINFFNPYVNVPNDIESYGAGVALTYNLGRGYTFNGTYNYANFTGDTEGFQAGFNTPEHKYTLSLGNRKVWKNVGFNVAWRWQDDFFWESSFGVGTIPAFGVLDAQVNYTWKQLKTVIKIGGSNVINNDYRTNIGGGFVGSQYYVSLTFDEFLN